MDTPKTIIFIHIPKCGGNGIVNIFKKSGYKVAQVCTWLCPGANHTSEDLHAVRRVTKCGGKVQMVPAGSKIYALVHHQLPRPKQPTDFIIASVRQPYSWYVSRWSYHIQCGIHKWGKDPNNVGDFQRWLKKHAGLYTRNFTESTMQDGVSVVDYFIRLETMDESLKELGGMLGVTLVNAGKTNASKHKMISDYYTPELAELVQKKDALIFEQFGYLAELNQ